jgi:hypothetical protein
VNGQPQLLGGRPAGLAWRSAEADSRHSAMQPIPPRREIRCGTNPTFSQRPNDRVSNDDRREAFCWPAPARCLAAFVVRAPASAASGESKSPIRSHPNLRRACGRQRVATSPSDRNTCNAGSRRLIRRLHREDRISTRAPNFQTGAPNAQALVGRQQPDGRPKPSSAVGRVTGQRSSQSIFPPAKTGGARASFRMRSMSA